MKDKNLVVTFFHFFVFFEKNIFNDEFTGKPIITRTEMSVHGCFQSYRVELKRENKRIDKIGLIVP